MMFRLSWRGLTVCMLFPWGILAAANLNAQEDLPVNPYLAVSGPAGQMVAANIHYFQSGQLAKTIATRIEIKPDGKPEPLEFGYDGLRILVTVPTVEPVQISLLNGETELVRRESEAVGVVQLELGQVASTEDVELPRTLPNKHERRFLSAFLDAIQASDSRAIVSDFKAANVEWETLDAYLQAVADELGALHSSSRSLDGWLSWEGRMGARVLSNIVRFEKGRCKFSLMVFEDRLVDVVVEAPKMPEDWFQGPVSIERYVRRSTKLVDLLFAAKIPAAQALFAGQVRETVTEEKLAQLSRTLRSQFGTQVSTVEFKTTSLGNFDSDSQSCDLTVYQAITLDTGKRCIADVRFEFPWGRDAMGRGSLVSIDVRETLQSAQPEIVQLAEQVLRAMERGDGRALTDWIHPDLASELDMELLQKRATEFSVPLGSSGETPDWDAWRGKTSRDNSVVMGPINTRNGTTNVQMSMLDRQLLGVNVLTPTASFSTLHLLTDRAEIVDLGTQFWRSLQTGDFGAAHGQLASGFAEQLPLETFAEMIRASSLSNLASDAVIQTDHVRMLGNVERSAPIQFATYSSALLDDGTRLELRCIFHRAADRGLEVIDFSTDFSEQFPVSDVASATRLASALNSEQPIDLVSMLSEADQQDVERRVLGGFLKKMQRRTGRITPPDHAQMIRRYIHGQRTEHLSCRLQTENVQGASLKATFRDQHLVSFSVSVPGFHYFLDEIEEGDDVYRTWAQEFCDRWMRDEDQVQLRMVDELRNSQTLQSLKRQRERATGAAGNYMRTEVLEVSVAEDENRVRLNAKIHFERLTLDTWIELSITAFAPLVSGVELKDLDAVGGLGF